MSAWDRGGAHSRRYGRAAPLAERYVRGTPDSSELGHPNSGKSPAPVPSIENSSFSGCWRPVPMCAVMAMLRANLTTRGKAPQDAHPVSPLSWPASSCAGRIPAFWRWVHPKLGGWPSIGDGRQRYGGASAGLRAELRPRGRERRLSCRAPLSRPSRPEQALTYSAPTSSTSRGGRESANRRGNRLPPQHFEEVAQVYRRALELGKSPLRAVEQAFHVSRPGASKYVRQARERGLLGYPSGPGVAGANPPASPIRKRRAGAA